MPSMARWTNMKSRIINSRAYEQLKNVFGQFDAADAIQKRALLNAEVFAAIRKSVQRAGGDRQRADRGYHLLDAV